MSQSTYNEKTINSLTSIQNASDWSNIKRYCMYTETGKRKQQLRDKIYQVEGKLPLKEMHQNI